MLLIINKWLHTETFINSILFQYNNMNEKIVNDEGNGNFFINLGHVFMNAHNDRVYKVGVHGNSVFNRDEKLEAQLKSDKKEYLFGQFQAIYHHRHNLPENLRGKDISNTSFNVKKGDHAAVAELCHKVADYWIAELGLR